MNQPKHNKVLIVEDHRDMLMVLRKYLEDQEFTVFEAESGEKGIELYQKHLPDLVLLDIMLPGISGLDVLNQIKNHKRNNGYIPVIIITAKNDISDIVRGLSTGADDYITKPFHFDELIARIKSALRLKELNEMLVDQSRRLEGANNEIKGLNSALLKKNRELRKNIYGLHSLFEVSMDLSSILELDNLINSALLTIIGQYSCKNALFLLRDEREQDRLHVFGHKGFGEEIVEKIALPADDPMVSFFLTHPAPIHLPDLEKQIVTTQAFTDLQNNEIELVMPVISSQKVNGVLCFGPRVKKGQYEERELQQITILGNIISIAVNNALLYEEVEQLSYTDGMTDLHNYRYFELRLKEEVMRHNRTRAGLSLLILDVDHFKNFNDTLGHQAGDRVLRKLAGILKETVRENDIVARYGGEEFAVILPAVDRAGAKILAERIRQRVEESFFEGEHVQPLGKVTVSVGEANLPHDSDNFMDLIRKADTALYAAKKNGRNQVKTFSPDVTGQKQ